MVGGGGAVGLSAIQLAVAAGCHVSTTCGGESIDRVLAAGAEDAVDYNMEVMTSITLYVFHHSLLLIYFSDGLEYLHISLCKLRYFGGFRILK